MLLFVPLTQWCIFFIVHVFCTNKENIHTYIHIYSVLEHINTTSTEEAALVGPVSKTIFTNCFLFPSIACIAIAMYAGYTYFCDRDRYNQLSVPINNALRDACGGGWNGHYGGSGYSGPSE